MALTRAGNQATIDRVACDGKYAKALLDEALALFFDGEPNTARIVLRDIVNGTIGFERLAETTGKPAKSLHRMLSTSGNPTMDNLADILLAVRRHLHVKIVSHVTRANADSCAAPLERSAKRTRARVLTPA